MPDSDAKYFEFFNVSTDAVFLLAVDDENIGKILYANDAAATLHGYSRQELLGMRINDLDMPDDADRVVERIERLKKEGVIRFEVQHLRKDGSVFSVEVTAGLVQIDGQPRVITFNRDISDRKDADAAFRTIEERWKFVLDGSEIGFWETDIATGKALFSNRWKELVGYDETEISTDMSELEKRVHPDDWPQLIEKVDRHIRGETTYYSSEHRVYCKDGSVKWILDRGLVVCRGADGSPLRMIGTFTDITERKIAEEKLRESEERYRTLTNCTSEAVVVHRGEGLLFVNPAAIKMFGARSESDLIGTPIRDRLHSEFRAKAFQRQTNIFNGIDEPMIEAKMLALDDSVIHTELRSVKIQFDGSPAIHTSIRDISKRKKAELALRESESRLKFALANMSHEIRTPLTAILGFTELLEDDSNTLSFEQRKSTVETIKSAGTHLLTIINDILDLSKIEADKMTIESVKTSLIRVLGEVISLMRPRAIGKGLTLVPQFTTSIPEYIYTDPTRVRQILMNLMGNALKFTEAGEITMRVGVHKRDDTDYLWVDIDDTGIGMNAEQAEKVFTAFGQGDSTVTRKFGGTGLGLTISRRLANLLGGDVQLVRAQPEKGCCFRLIIPLVAVADSATWNRLDAVEETSAYPIPHTISTLSGHILLAEDGIDNQRLIAFHLKKAGATVSIADNGRIALEMIERAEQLGAPFDLLLTDVQMPEMDGYTLARTLRTRQSKLPIVALTAYAMSDDRQRSLDAGCDDYQSKPINKIDLIDTCARWMKKIATGLH